MDLLTLSWAIPDLQPPAMITAHTRGTAKDKRREGVWTCEMPAAVDLYNGRVTRPPGTPKDPCPTTELYHNNEEYMSGTPRISTSIYHIPPLPKRRTKSGIGWKFLENETTPAYGGIRRKIGDIYSEIDAKIIDTKFSNIESYWKASKPISLP